MPRPGIDERLIGAQNESAFGLLQSDFDALRGSLDRRGVDIDKLKERAAGFAVAVPSWVVGSGGTRLSRFPAPGAPRNIFDKLDDCAVIHQLTGAASFVSLHLPWDRHDDPKELKVYAGARGLAFAAIHANTSLDAPGQEHSYRFGSLSHVDPAVRRQAIAHSLDCIALGKQIDAKALTVSAGEGSSLPGQVHLGAAFERYLASAKEIYAAVPDDWRLYIEHRLSDTASYASVAEDWGASYLVAAGLGAKAFCLVDTAQQAPGTNLEILVARLIQQGKLGGLRFSDTRHDAGALNPYRLFLVFNEVADALASGASVPACTIDQPHGAADPIESIVVTVMEIERAYVQAHLIDREALATYRESNDALMASELLKQAFRTDVEPILAMVRHEKGAAIDPLAAYRAAGYRQRITDTRPRLAVVGGGIA